MGAPTIDRERAHAPSQAQAEQPRLPWRDRFRARARQLGRNAMQPEFIITFAIVAAASLFTFWQLQPSKIFLNTTPSGGDLGAHVWLPWFIKDHLFPNFKLTGWAPDWYGGFPALTYYFPGPMVAIAVISYVIPYNIAFKLVVISGLVTLPIAAWAFGRLSKMAFPGPACLAAATLPYLFGREFTIYGGNIASTMAGEFCFSISLSLALVFLGLVARGLRTGKGRALAAVVLAATCLCHVLPTFFAVGGALVLFAMRARWRRWRWLLPVLVIGGCITAFWSLPFEYRLPYATNMGYQKITLYLSSLFPSGDLWLYLLAAVGFVLAIVRRHEMGTYLGLMSILAALVFRVAPQARLWNARVLPFWFLCLYLLAGVAFYEIGTMLTSPPRFDEYVSRGATMVVPFVTVLVALAWVCYPLHLLPFGHYDAATGKYSWMGISSSDTSFVPDWVDWDFSGYQSSGKSRRAEYAALVAEMKKLGNTPGDGCGQADWEYEPELNDMGTPDALMLLPYWTNSCIGSAEGLYYESSATTPYHFLNEALLSDQPSDPVRGLTYASKPDVAEGVEQLQLMGVKYYMAISPTTEAQADVDPSLTLVGTVGPYPVQYTSGSTTTTEMRTWKIYKVAGSATVAPLAYQPVVMSGVAKDGAGWQTAAVDWFDHPDRYDVMVAASGPSSWARVPVDDPSPPATALPPVTVSHIGGTTQTITFDVNRTGVPVLVKTSYFPNWQVTGAKGIYRVAPNEMVVIPTSHHVELTYGYTPVDYAGFALSLLGLIGLVFLWRLGPVSIPLPRRRAHAMASSAPVARGLAEPLDRLEYELGYTHPPGSWADDDLDVWLGQPGGIGLARYHATGWGLGEGLPSWDPAASPVGTTGVVPVTGQPPATAREGPAGQASAPGPDVTEAGPAHEQAEATEGPEPPSEGDGTAE